MFSGWQHSWGNTIIAPQLCVMRLWWAVWCSWRGLSSQLGSNILVPHCLWIALWIAITECANSSDVCPPKLCPQWFHTDHMTHSYPFLQLPMLKPLFDFCLYIFGVPFKPALFAKFSKKCSNFPTGLQSEASCQKANKVFSMASLCAAIANAYLVISQRPRSAETHLALIIKLFIPVC